MTTRPAVHMEIETIRWPGAELLAELSGYDHDAFGPTGLRPFDLALVAWTGRLYVGRVNGQVAAGCQLVRILDRPHMVWVVGFYVRPAWQGRGLGTELLAGVARVARKEKFQRLSGEILRDNLPTQAIFKKTGFKLKALDDPMSVEAALAL